ncbi:hypothetical protein ACF068_26310 [Streptomyces sp. NPDC016309]|uniref:hypothetical protein n=1 Tax=Streptomyces sp. NPDC016309 TaxID=3364965 RepID=UPI0036FE2281
MVTSATGRDTAFVDFRAPLRFFMVATDSRDPERSAFRPDDDLPHVRRWEAV